MYNKYICEFKCLVSRENEAKDMKNQKRGKLIE